MFRQNINVFIIEKKKLEVFSQSSSCPFWLKGLTWNQNVGSMAERVKAPFLWSTVWSRLRNLVSPLTLVDSHSFVLG